MSQMLFVPESNKLIAVGACGYLACLDIRKGKLIARSDNMDQALTSVALVRVRSGGWRWRGRVRCLRVPG